MTGASEVFDLADDFGKAAGKIGAALYDVFVQEGEHFAEDWAENARETSGEHGKHYPDSISAEGRLSFGGILVEIGPESSKKQGGMGPGFEFGSKNQPPHLDGLRAMDPALLRVERAVDATIGFLLP